MALEPVGKKAGEGGAKLQIDNPLVAEAFRKYTIQDAHKVLADYGITVADFEQFAAGQHSKYMSIVQPEPLYAMGDAIPPPVYEEFPEFDMSNSLSPEDSNLATEMFGKALSVGGKADGSGGSEAAPAGVQGHVDEWNSFWTNVLEPKIFESQFMQEMQNKSDELERELQKIVAMARSGQIDDPTILILAFAKSQIEKYGMYGVYYGRVIMRDQERSKVEFELFKKGGQDVAALQRLQQVTKEGTQSTQDATRAIQSVTQNVQATLSFVDGFNKIYRNMKDDIIRKLSAGQ
ncbi:MAG: hypothetical protein HYU98_03795 [Deltaproteobacteria bacterium]|nr:hypothetical protein [Deltaproteobacteria bacterium]